MMLCFLLLACNANKQENSTFQQDEKREEEPDENLEEEADENLEEEADENPEDEPDENPEDEPDENNENTTLDSDIFWDDIENGVPYYFQFQDNLGTMLAGNVYLTRHDNTSGLTTTSSISEHVRISESTNTSMENRRLSIWGALFSTMETSEGLCLALDPSAPECIAKVLGPYHEYSPGESSDFIFYSHSIYSSVLTNKITDFYTIPEPYRYRDIGGILYRGAGLLQFITNKNEQLQFDALLDQAASLLVDTFEPDHNTSLGLDISTTYFVIIGLYEYYKISGRQDLKDEILVLWEEYRTTVDSYFPEFLDPNSFYYDWYSPAGVGQYLQIATIVEKLDVPAYHNWTVDIFDHLSMDQRISIDEADCNSMPMLYGGWSHDYSDCSQKIGYNSYTLRGLLMFEKHLRDNDFCTDPFWNLPCTQLESSIYPAVAWYLQLQNTNGSFPSEVPGEPDGSTPLAHGGYGLGSAELHRFMLSYKDRLPTSIQGDFSGTVVNQSEYLNKAELAMEYLVNNPGHGVYDAAVPYMNLHLSNLTD